MSTPKKKHLIELMIESGVKWPEGAEYAAQDKRDSKVYFFPSKPTFSSGYDYYSCDDSFLTGCNVLLPSLCRNWHQTIVTREQYAEALTNAAITIENNHYNSMTNQTPIKTIEQLASDYHTLAAEAECLQLEADATLKLANEALVTLQKAGELLGLVISVDTLQKCTEQHQQPVITNWRDLQVGDIIECISYNDKRDDSWPGGWATQNIGTQQVVSKINDSNGKISIKDSQDSGYAFKFIHRP